ncbi:methyltransferase family protein [Paraburkholderia phytofirmans]|uniref:methyltransferase family protein n=1 Tax=Paraburkholderia phytofirmans TaxID=261302 RepID=UPI0009EEE115|nr:isoprenylcysteine carboxylmethyltransferase family protein [Paraburkholderia phytofirmans]
MINTETVGLATPPADASARTTPDTAPRSRDALLELSARTGTAVLLSVFAYAAIQHWRADSGRITLLLLMVEVCFTIGLSLFTRVPMRRDWTPFAFLCSMGGTYYFLAVQLGPGVRLVPEAVGASLQVFGICWQLFAKASLRRSFGILPANRGVVSCGAYRFMRHPMYLGYLVTDIGFLIANFGVQNLLIYGIQFALQAGRIYREERLLSTDAAYRSYKGKVRYRVIPGLF